MRILRNLLIIVALLLSAAAPANTFERLAERAARSFEWKEWSSAAAMYELMLKQRPTDSDIYVHAIVASQMIPDSVAAVDLVERAMSHEIGLAELLAGVRELDFSIGSGDTYGTFLYSLRQAMPWMSRALDHQLLDYYSFRDDGPMIVRYARVMLAGLPRSTVYLEALARGYLLQDKMPEAADTWRRILEIDPDNYNALLSLGNYLITTGDKAGAIELLRRARSLRPTPYVDRLIQNANT